MIGDQPVRPFPSVPKNGIRMVMKARVLSNKLFDRVMMPRLKKLRTTDDDSKPGDGCCG